MTILKELRPVMPILIGASVMLSLGMGVRQSFGLVMPALTREHRTDGLRLRPGHVGPEPRLGLPPAVAGALAVRLGFRPVMTTGARRLLCRGSCPVRPGRRPDGRDAGRRRADRAGARLYRVRDLAGGRRALGAGAAAQRRPGRHHRHRLAGGAAVGALGQMLTTELGWRAGLLGFPGARRLHAAGCLDRRPGRPPDAAHPTLQVTSAPLRRAWRFLAALRNPSFLVMTAAYFVCGMQLLFITTHLPSYLAICGMDPSLSAGALGAIALFNVFGSLFFGWAGGPLVHGCWAASTSPARSCWPVTS